MNIICRLRGHKFVFKGYGNKYGTGDKSVCVRCGHTNRKFLSKTSELLINDDNEVVENVQS